MLTALVLELTAVKDAFLPVSHGALAYAAALDLILRHDVELARDLHDQEGSKPLKVGLLEAGEALGDRRLRISAGERHLWRLAAAAPLTTSAVSAAAAFVALAADAAADEVAAAASLTAAPALAAAAVTASATTGGTTGAEYTASEAVRAALSARPAAVAAAPVTPAADRPAREETESAQASARSATGSVS